MTIDNSDQSLIDRVEDNITFRKPRSTDGLAVNRLIADCPPLDTNSVYCNLLQCSHFADTSIAVERDGELVGFISGYRPPAKPETLFVWQVAVSPNARGIGLGKRMLATLAERLRPAGVKFIDTTITPDNEASWALFRSVARQFGADTAEDPFFLGDEHFGGNHADEILLRIGPF